MRMNSYPGNKISCAAFLIRHSVSPSIVFGSDAVITTTNKEDPMVTSMIVVECRIQQHSTFKVYFFLWWLDYPRWQLDQYKGIVYSDKESIC